MRDDDDARHLSTVYRNCFPGIYRRAMALLRDKDQVWDVTQDVFLAYMALYRMKALRGEASPFTLLYTMVTSRCVDRLRHRQRWYGALEDLKPRDEEQPQGAEGRLPPDDGGMPRIEALCDLATLTQGEPPEVLTAAVRYYVDGWSFEEVGKELGLPRKKVSTMLDQFAERANKRAAQLKKRAK